MSATATGYLASKPRYEILDGLRGVAAMIVVAFHLLETYSKGPAYQVLNHGYLAVDFFFVLSGFVIGYAYDDRWNRMSLKGFFKRRLVRLHPMVIMGSLIGALFFYFGSAAFPMIAGVQWWEVLLICLYDAARAAVVGHPRLGRDQPAERTRMVAALRIHRQYPLCPRHPALPEIRAGAVRGRGRGADAGPHAESRPVRPAGNPDAPLGTGIFVNVAIFLLAVGLAWACLKLYDLPVREWLKRHWLMK